MGNSAPQRDARSLREILAGLNRVEQHKAAANYIAIIDAEIERLK